MAVHPQCRTGRSYTRTMCFSKLNDLPHNDARCSNGRTETGNSNSVFKAIGRTGIVTDRLYFPSTRYDFYVKVKGITATGWIRFYATTSAGTGTPTIVCDSGRVSFTAKRTGR
ncbi:MAG: hypothetical protein QOI91_1258 [Solirubrobacteraceae bacterium]|nr:hypothetical protein [Solirubrobacteraceae bacterium]MDX6670895.1 hypothetical protein [Solirubrobacteraceae bacterium]